MTPAMCAFALLSAQGDDPKQATPVVPPVARPEGVGATPLQPTGFPTETVGELPSTDDPKAGFRLIRSGGFKQIGNRVVLSNGAEFVFRGYHVFCDEAEGDTQAEIFTLIGNVQLIGEQAVVRGDKVTVDFNAKSYRAIQAKSILHPGLLKGRVKGDVFAKGSQSSGNRNETVTLDGDLTTCNYEHPHFDLESESSTVRPGVRAIFRKAKLNIFGRTVLRLPFLSVPLDDRTYKYLPEFGQSPDEGYYVKNRFAIPLKSNASLDTHEDYMSKLGTGLGTDFRYISARSSGVARFYKVSGTANTLTMSNQHRQEFGWGSFSLDNDYQKNNYLTAPGSTVLTSRGQLVFPQNRGTSTRLSLNRTSTDTSGYKNENRVITLGDDRTWNSQTRTSLNLDYSTTSSTSGSTSTDQKQMNLRFSGDEDLKAATAKLEYQRTIPIGDSPRFSGGSDQTPVLTLSSDANRLSGKGVAQNWPYRTYLSLGEFQDPTRNGRLTRTAFDFAFQRPDRSQNRFTSQFNGDFKQGIYSDNTAQYTLNFGSQFAYRLGKDTSANFRYNYLRPYGYSPLSLDRSGRTHVASADVSFRPLRTFLIGAQTGFDFLQADRKDVGWQQVGIRSEYRPVDYFLFRSQAMYDPNLGSWTNVRLDLTYRPGATLVSLGSRYDAYRHVWSNANLFVDNLTFGKTKLSAVLSYNGFLKQFDSQQYSIIYDLHCAEAVISIIDNSTGFRSGREITFFIRLKALPFDSAFGSGRRGQAIGSSNDFGTSY